jgi:tRNA pseudouridine55 synthase
MNHLRKMMQLSEEGLLLVVDKPAGWTSFDVVARVRRLASVRKVGHAGTLDPFATGVLLLLLGKMTRQQDRLMAGEKEYLLTARLGRTADSHDVTGKLTGTSTLAGVEQQSIEAALEQFRGVIQQVPPMHSALKVNGQRLYKLAHKGKSIERKPRQVEINRLQLRSWQPPRLELEVTCGKGTYIRSLVRDLGRALGCGAFVETLVRTRVGEYRIADALTLDELEQKLK